MKRNPVCRCVRRSYGIEVISNFGAADWGASSLDGGRHDRPDHSDQGGRTAAARFLDLIFDHGDKRRGQWLRNEEPEPLFARMTYFADANKSRLPFGEAYLYLAARSLRDRW